MGSLVTFSSVGVVGGGHKRSVRSCAWKPGSGPRRTDGQGVQGIGESVLVTGSFDASAGIWRRWEAGSGLIKDDDEAGVERDFTTPEDRDEDEEWQFAVVLDGHDSEIKCVAYSSVGPFLATCSRDKSVWIWEELEDDNYETVAVLQEHEGDVKCVAWHPEEVLVASGSYDDSVRLWREEGDGEDWGCAAVLEGFGGTVWGVEFEPVENVGRLGGADGAEQWLEERRKSGPRLATCSDDLSIRIWRRIPKEKKDPPTGQGKMPSILKTTSIEEEWVEEARLPQTHERSIYAISWSKLTGKIVSCGGDGKIVVFEERWNDKKDTAAVDGIVLQADESPVTHNPTEWTVVAEYEDAHDVFEINHVAWTVRADKGKRYDGEEIVVSTGDDGEVKVWTLESEP